MARRYKFDDCIECRWKKRPSICAECDVGEQFEEISQIESVTRKIYNSEKGLSEFMPLSTDDDEPEFDFDELEDLNPEDEVDEE